MRGAPDKVEGPTASGPLPPEDHDLIDRGAAITIERAEHSGAAPGAGVASPADERSERSVVTFTQKIRGVLRIADFRRLWLAMSLSSLGDWLGFLAITALATSLAEGYRAANFALGGVLIFRLLPALLLGPLAGAFADRFDRRYTMVVCDVIRFVLFLSIPLVGELVWLFVAQFLIEAVSLFWIPAKDASVPNLVRRDQLETANQLSLVTTYGLTPVLAAGIFAVLSTVGMAVGLGDPTDLSLYLNAGTFLVAAATVFTLRSISGHRTAGGESGHVGLIRSLREGLSFIGHTPLIRGLIVGIVGAFCAAGAVIGTAQSYAGSLGGGDAAYGVLFGAMFLGLGLGISVGPQVARDLSRRRLFGVSIVLAGLSLTLVAFMPLLSLGVGMVTAVGCFAGIAYLSGVTLLGGEVDDAIRGRTFAFVQSLVRISLILSLASAPFLVGLVRQRQVSVGSVDVLVDGSRITLVVAGALAMGVGVLAYRQMDDRRSVPLLADLFTALRRDTTARRRLAHGGVFIAFEGGEGAGKSTQLDLLARWLIAAGHEPCLTREPGATELGVRIRALLLDPSATDLTARAEALLYAADRAHHVDTVLRPVLERDGIVLTDRYLDSSLAYQGAGRTLDLDEVNRISRWATQSLEPDLTVLLDVDPALGLTRAADRSYADRLERESLEFHQRVRAAFLTFAEAEPDRYLVLDATAAAEEIAGAVQVRVAELLERLRPPAVAEGTTP
ncbi:dTMP kinase [soil metagenome]